MYLASMVLKFKMEQALFELDRHDKNNVSRLLREEIMKKKGKRKVQGVQQSQTAAPPRHQEEEETDKSKQAQIDQTYEKH